MWSCYARQSFILMFYMPRCHPCGMFAWPKRYTHTDTLTHIQTHRDREKRASKGKNGRKWERERVNGVRGWYKSSASTAHMHTYSWSACACFGYWYAHTNTCAVGRSVCVCVCVEKLCDDVDEDDDDAVARRRVSVTATIANANVYEHIDTGRWSFRAIAVQSTNINNNSQQNLVDTFDHVWKRRQSAANTFLLHLSSVQIFGRLIWQCCDELTLWFVLLTVNGEKYKSKKRVRECDCISTCDTTTHPMSSRTETPSPPSLAAPCICLEIRFNGMATQTFLWMKIRRMACECVCS